MLVCHKGEGVANAQQLLEYELGSPIFQNSCNSPSDADHDCLVDSLENDLAWIVAPQYFFDENESCAAGAQYSPNHFFQVRPVYSQNWPNAGSVLGVYWLSISYYMMFPHDCNDAWFQPGHQGDIEKVIFNLYTTDFVHWKVYNGRFYHHSSPYHDFSGEYLAARASEIGALYPSVAADQNGHGSWPGRVGNSPDCAGPEDDTFDGRRDCFAGTMSQHYNSWNWSYLWGGYTNIGEPGAYNPNVLSSDSSGFYFSRDTQVGSGQVKEYFSLPN